MIAPAKRSKYSSHFKEQAASASYRLFFQLLVIPPNAELPLECAMSFPFALSYTEELVGELVGVEAPLYPKRVPWFGFAVCLPQWLGLEQEIDLAVLSASPLCCAVQFGQQSCCARSLMVNGLSKVEWPEGALPYDWSRALNS